MNSLLQSQPSAIQHIGNSTLFYFGTPSPETYLLPGKSKFEIVHSPINSYGWEFVCYQWFEAKNGLYVLERRALELEEITYFEHMLTNSKAYS